DASISEGTKQRRLRTWRAPAAPPVPASMQETSFQEPALAKYFQNQLLKREIRSRPRVAELISAAVGLDAFAESVELGPIGAQQRRGNGDFPADVASGVYHLKFSLKFWINFCVTGDRNNENIMAEMAQDIRGALKPFSTKHVGDPNRQSAPPCFRAIGLE